MLNRPRAAPHSSEGTTGIRVLNPEIDLGNLLPVDRGVSTHTRCCVSAIRASPSPTFHPPTGPASAAKTRGRETPRRTVIAYTPARHHGSRSRRLKCRASPPALLRDQRGWDRYSAWLSASLPAAAIAHRRDRMMRPVSVAYPRFSFIVVVAAAMLWPLVGGAPSASGTAPRGSRVGRTCASGDGGCSLCRGFRGRRRRSETEIIEPVAERRRRPRKPRQSEQPPPAEPPRRRSRTSSTREPRKAVPPADRRASYERPERRRRYDDYQPREPHVSNGNGTHHPVSRVRYRGGGEDTDDRAEYRSRPRSSRSSWEADSWEHDI